jgi:aspartyl-tRNA(Asn)/glutamyl-tRNA(Gln) amidotransferase subunit B
VLNKKVVELAMKTAIALGCKIEEKNIFARKHYFYPDLPKNYQVSQYDLPLATGGHIDIEVEGKVKKIGITRIHLEEDAGKLIHVGAGSIMGAEESLVDYNRTGVPLMEIVSEPDIRSAKEAAAYVQALANLLQYLEVCDAKMEEGSLRCDANISIRPYGQEKFGTKTEVKNMNSFKAIEKALIAEEKRHNEVIEEGGTIVQETRFFDENNNTTYGMRSKEFAHDYRYFPEPDLVPIEPQKEWIEEIRELIGELPWQRKDRFIKEYQLPAGSAELLILDKFMANFFEETDKLYPKATIVSNWLMGEVTAYLNENKKKISDISLLPTQLSELLTLIDEGTLSNKLAKNTLLEVMKSGKQVKEVVAASGMTQISDQGEIEKLLDEVIKNNPKPVEEFKAGKEATLTFLVGQVMKLSKGRVNPAMANKLLKEKLK